MNETAGNEEPRMFKATIGLVAMLLPVSTAQAEAAWDIAHLWQCRGERSVHRDNESICSGGVPKAVFEIDFASGAVANRDMPAGTEERITKRNFTPSAPVKPPGTFHGYSFIVTSGEQTFFVEEKGQDAAAKPTYRFRMITSYGTGDMIHYGTCAPR